MATTKSRGAALATLRKEYRAAKAARTRTGKAYRKSKSASNLKAYQHAERRWQVVGEELGKRTGTHKPRHAETRIFGRKKRLSAKERSANARVTRRRKSTRSRRSR